ncbi:MAG: SpoIIE family protein phosphatase [Spirochaetes bacterium]|nr:SpoIIE family protein phosphatase [Spirochaetota bacterium]
MKRKEISISLLMMILCLVSGCSGEPRPPALRGAMDLSAWDFRRNGPVALDGTWDFYWNRLYGPEAFASEPPPSPDFHAAVPDSWTGFSGARRRPREGFATYRLRVALPSGERTMALRLTEVMTARRIFVNGSLVSSVGRVGKSRGDMAAANRPCEAAFTARGTADIIVQVSNFDDKTGGILRSVLLGTEEQIRERGRRSLAFDLFLFGSLLLIGLYHLSLYPMRRRDHSPLFFGLFCVVIALRVIVTGEVFIHELVPAISWLLQIRIECITLGCAAILAHFFRTLFPDEIAGAPVTVFVWVTAVYALVVMTTPVYVFSTVLDIYQALLVAMGLYLIAMMVRAVARRRRGAAVILGGFLVLFAVVMNDILYSQLVIQTAYLTPLGLVAFVFSQALVISMKFSHGYEDIEVFSKELEQYALNLEDVIRDRTMQLEKERNALKSRNSIIEEQLRMAKRIQQQIIPRHSPVGFIHARYKPMDHVGGDFYDFIQFQGSDDIGIFVSDVSGHGVPAAFITSMIKSYILNLGREREDPAVLLRELNGMLAHQTGGHFVTAFYGIFDRSSGRIRYSVAGHNMPFVVEAGRTYQLQGAKGIPLAIMDNAEMEGEGRVYRNSAQRLPSGGRLVLYTDGLVEIVGSGGTFDERELAGAMLEFSHLGGDEFVESLFGRIAAFRGGESFEDDICLICIDM